MRADLLHLMSAPSSGLERLLRHGAPVTPDQLAGWTYDGVRLGLPALVDRLLLKFRMSFRGAPGGVEGWHERVRQDGLAAPWTPRRLFGRALTYGRFCAVPAASHPRWGDRYPQATVLDLGRGEPPWSPLRPLRAYVVAVHEGSCERLLGRLCLDLGVKRAKTASYFALSRGEALPG
ncbi:MAG: hypothetical protein CSA66_02485 [Proteobacteria bacterium]|nr:MAG: hypothetical protein CSA66_02485 [Pseudomonadota bacterium]